MMDRIGRFVFVVLTAAFVVPGIAPAQPAAAPPPEDVQTRYTKYEFRIPMRDGKRLFTAVYVPKDASVGPYPFLMDRTPYRRGALWRRPIPTAPWTF